MADRIQLTAHFPVTPDELYRAWLSSPEHTAFTGSPAEIFPKTGTEFSAWDSYITGKNLELYPGRKIVQSWRTAEFDEDAPDSRLTLEFEIMPGGCLMKLDHQDLPEGDGPKYEDGWKNHYLEPMKVYFGF